MKTVLEYLKEIPGYHGKLALLRANRCLSHKVDSMAMAINAGIYWSNTPEKHRFWIKVYDHYNKNPPPPLPAIKIETIKQLRKNENSQ